MINKPLVSVIIPLYNHEKYIKQTIESVVHQGYGLEHIQLIVVDDCSPDSSAQVVQELLKLYDFQFIINPKNKGICNNLNDALSLIKGKYVCITGSDDFWSLDKLEIQVQFMESNDHVAVCSGNVIKVDSEGHPLAEDKQRLSPERTYSFKDVFMRDFPFSSTCAMIRATVFDEVGLYDPNLKIEDYYMWLKIAHAGHSIHFQADILGYYRIHNANTILKSWLIYSEMRKIISAYQYHEIYPQALRRLKIVYFPQIAQIDKRRAVSMLPAAISHTRFFYRGLFYLFKPLNS
jgi:alpha-1,3-rhamnosyltransferase